MNSARCPAWIRRGLSLSLWLAPLLAGCAGGNWTTGAGGPHAARIATLFWFMTAILTVVWIVVMSVLAWGLWRGGADRTASAGDPLTPAEPPALNRRLNRWVGVGVAVTTVLLFVMLVASYGTGRAIATAPDDDALKIKVTGNQWWWSFEYQDGGVSQWFTTANEMHIPTGRPVKLELVASDVIHSFWVPQLHGKRDLIPGRRNELVIQADEAGVYRGRCAEFCGFQHTLMGLLVIAESPSAYAKWADQQRKPASDPADPLAKTGQEVFFNAPCPMCHTVQGTTAAGRTAPDLTHIASRSTLAAVTVPNNRGYLAGWILDPQHIKPRNRMPQIALTGDELQALLAYLETLK